MFYTEGFVCKEKSLQLVEWHIMQIVSKWVTRFVLDIMGNALELYSILLVQLSFILYVKYVQQGQIWAEILIP